MDHTGIFSFGEHPDQLEDEPQTLFGITIKLASVHPAIDGTDVPDSADVGGELAADQADEKALHDALRDQGEMQEWLPLEPPANLNIGERYVNCILSGSS